MIIPSLKPYWVISPEYSYVNPILDDGSGPVDVAVDAEIFWAKNSSDAKILAVRSWRKNRQHWRQQNYVQQRLQSNLNPFVGLKTRFAICKHGVVEDHECVECVYEWEQRGVS